MSRSQIFEALFQSLATDPILIPLLGPQTPQNLRLYRTYPQLASMLKGNGTPGDQYEPQGREGWLVIEEPEPEPRAANQGFETVYENIEIAFHIFATAYSLADDVADILDSYYQWSCFQQRLVSFGDRWLVFSRRFKALEAYAQEIKLYHKTYMYRMELVLAEQPV